MMGEPDEVATLGAVVSLTGGLLQTGPFGSQLHASDYSLTGTPLVMPTNLGDNEIREDGIARVGAAHVHRLRRHALRKGDIVFSRRGDVGRRSIVREAEAGWLCGTGCLAARFGSSTNGVNRAYVAEYLGSSAAQSWLADNAVGGTMPNLNTSILAALPVWMPTRTEQDRIVEMLDDARQTITTLNSAVAKKQAIKQGMMQQLLTGKTRLPGFTGEWTVHRIGDFAQVKAGGTPSTAVLRYWGGDVRWMSSGEIHGKRVYEVEGRITSDGLRESAAQLLPVGTVLMALAGQGKTRGTVAVSRVELSTNQSIAGILPSGAHDPDFLFYNLDTRYEELRGESSGDGGRGGLNLTIIKNLDVLMPPRDEQTAIARVLADTDDEIDLLRRRVDKARAAKVGMMHELLTGRTRLPVEAAS